MLPCFDELCEQSAALAQHGRFVGAVQFDELGKASDEIPEPLRVRHGVLDLGLKSSAPPAPSAVDASFLSSSNT